MKLLHYSKVIVVTLVLSILAGCGKNSILKQQLESSDRRHTSESIADIPDSENIAGVLGVLFLTAIGRAALLYAHLMEAKARA
ncbi:MAG: hypothetical protein LBV62_00115 [Rickettsiales bacterium]|nr:hypothetical protein [Rickettsiales bacterium]